MHLLNGGKMLCYGAYGLAESDWDSRVWMIMYLKSMYVTRDYMMKY